MSIVVPAVKFPKYYYKMERTFYIGIDPVKNPTVTTILRGYIEGYISSKDSQSSPQTQEK